MRYILIGGVGHGASILDATIGCSSRTGGFGLVPGKLDRLTIWDRPPPRGSASGLSFIAPPTCLLAPRWVAVVKYSAGLRSMLRHHVVAGRHAHLARPAGLLLGYGALKAGLPLSSVLRSAGPEQ